MSAIERIDQAIYSIERKLVGWISLGMALIVFLDVVHRIFSRKPGRLATILGPIVNQDPMALDSFVTPLFIFLCFWFVVYAAIRSRAKTEQPALLRSFGVTAALTLVVQAFLYFVPEGLVWSPYLGLAALLWIGLLGASMATHNGQHLSMELGEKIWPKKLLGPVRKLNGSIVGAFCAFLAVLATTSLQDHLHDWSSGPGAGLIPAIGWPKWVVFTVIPYAFGMMALRFWAQAIGWVKRPEAHS